ncbi:hypothetical protein [Pseudomonas rhizoryzae]|uniref:hypothetical protein n=1 Tax=Pseudomonas rhizoryzae TaxID=2571129 RepID=UPI0010C1BCE2|nr:hypothetical protein [Pseudomonas rhizoryzae]
MTKPLEAIVRHERAAQEVARLRREIGKALALCSVSVEHQDWSLPAARRNELTEPGGRIKTHLWQALHHLEPSSCGYGMVRLDDHDVGNFLADAECEHCRKAWELHLKRKVARQELGRARVAIRAIGRAALAKVAS